MMSNNRYTPDNLLNFMNGQNPLNVWARKLLSIRKNTALDSLR
jgi:hypothetical protein